jgi:hypothetical protein
MRDGKSIFRRVAQLLFRTRIWGDRIRGDIDAELMSHLEMRIEDNIAHGMSREEARRDAYSRFGNRGAIHEQVATENSSLRWPAGS